MGRLSFVSMLFVMALSCLGLAISDSSWGWAIGGAILLAVAVRALRQFNTERETGPETASNGFIVFAFLVLIAGFAAIFILFRP